MGAAGPLGMVAAPETQPVPMQAPAQEPAAPPAAPPAALPQQLAAGFGQVLGTLLPQFSPEEMQARQQAAMQQMAAEEERLLGEQARLDKQRKWVGLMGFGAALQGGDPGRVFAPFEQERQGVASALANLRRQREELPMALAARNLEDLRGFADAYGTYGKLNTPQGPDIGTSFPMQQRLGIARNLYPGMTDQEIVANNLHFSPQVDNAVIDFQSRLIGNTTTARETASAPFDKPSSGRGGGGGGLTANQRNNIVAQARQAIAQGADEAAVRQRAREMGVEF